MNWTGGLLPNGSACPRKRNSKQGATHRERKSRAMLTGLCAEADLISKAVHVIIHATSETTIRQYLKTIQLDDSMLKKLNKLRIMAEMPPIIL